MEITRIRFRLKHVKKYRKTDKATRRVKKIGILPHTQEIPAEKKFGGGTRDVVEQASWESFPASDPPAY